jgi:hypothetical protein
MRQRIVKTTGGGGCGTTKDDAKRGEWEANTQVGSWQTREAEEDGIQYTSTKQAMECVFDQICSFGLYVIRYVMFLCFQMNFRTKQTKCFLAYVIGMSGHTPHAGHLPFAHVVMVFFFARHVTFW